MLIHSLFKYTSSSACLSPPDNMGDSDTIQKLEEYRQGDGVVGACISSQEKRND